MEIQMEYFKNSLELFTELTDEELENIHGGQNMSMTDGRFEWIYMFGQPYARVA